MNITPIRFLAVLLIALALGVLALSVPVSVHAEPLTAALEGAPQQPAPPLLGNIQAIAAGWSHTCGLTVEGGVKCWGENGFGQLGDGTNTDRWMPVDVIGLSRGVQAIVGGNSHTCALTVEGGVKCWGNNFLGQLGDGTGGDFSYSLTPVDVVGLSSGVQAIDSGWFHTCALTADNGVKCWGYNGAGQLGDGTTTDRLTAVDVVGLNSGVRVITAGWIHTCALITNDGVKCWGENRYGQLGDGTTIEYRLTPTAVTEMTTNVEAISAGHAHTCALLTVGGVKCWGYNFFGQLGDGTTNHHSPPVAVSGLIGGVQAIVAASDHTCALMASGESKCWGDNSSGQLGDGTTTNRSTPTPVSGLVSGVEAIVGGGFHTCALTTEGRVKCWGINDVCQLGDGTTTNRLTPVDVVAGPSFISGRVIDIGLHAIADATVKHIDPSGQLTTTSTDAEGVFTVTVTATSLHSISIVKTTYSFFPDFIQCTMPSHSCKPFFIGAELPNDIPLLFLPDVRARTAEKEPENVPFQDEKAVHQSWQ